MCSSEEQLLGVEDDLADGVSGLECGVDGIDGWVQGVPGLDIPAAKNFSGFFLLLSLRAAKTASFIKSGNPKVKMMVMFSCVKIHSQQFFVT